MKYALIMSLIAAGAAAGVTANGEVEATAAQSCESLTSLTLPHTTITLARMVGPGAFTRPTSIGALDGLSVVATRQNAGRSRNPCALNHCAMDGAHSFDGLAALEEWVEEKKAPERLVLSHLANGVADRTRPVCPYPQVAEYNGTGSTDAVLNFVCRTP